MSDITEVSPAGTSCPAGEVAEEGCVSTSATDRDRSERFLNRLDRELVGLDRCQRDALLRRQIDNWEARYCRFIRSQGKSEYCADPKQPIDAADFICTIAGLHKRWNREI
jgi:hypothetical protein